VFNLENEIKVCAKKELKTLKIFVPQSPEINNLLLNCKKNIFFNKSVRNVFLDNKINTHYVDVGVDFNTFFSLQDPTNFLYSFKKIKIEGFLDNRLTKNSVSSFILNEGKIENFKNYSDLSESSRTLKKTSGLVIPFRLKKNLLNLDTESNLFFSTFGNGQNSLVEKQFSNSLFLVLKQKKYKKRGGFVASQSIVDTKNTSAKTILLNNRIISEYLDPSVAYDLMKKNKKRCEAIPTTLAKRILRTKKTLVLPAHTNITLTTNSFDIVHS